MTAAVMPRFSNWAGLDVSILDQIPQILAAMSEIRPQPQQRRHKHFDAAGTDSHTAQYAAAWQNKARDQCVLYVRDQGFKTSYYNPHSDDGACSCRSPRSRLP
jgi:hypothetical protein